MSLGYPFPFPSSKHPPPLRSGGCLEARAGIEPAIEVLQTPALPLGYLAETLRMRESG